jgi:hypothetical protein
VLEKGSLADQLAVAFPEVAETLAKSRAAKAAQRKENNKRRCAVIQEKNWEEGWWSREVKADDPSFNLVPLPRQP